VAYAYDAKVRLLGVDRAELEARGAVSEAVARQMAEGARSRLGATWGLGTTGIAGPGGGTETKPVGTVWLALAGPGGTAAWRLGLGDRGREVVRLATVKSALEQLRRSALGVEA
jgi:nicotinamide-nucleotide amidase